MLTRSHAHTLTRSHAHTLTRSHAHTLTALNQYGDCYEPLTATGYGCLQIGLSVKCSLAKVDIIGPASLARENEAGGSWGQEVHILHVNI